MPVSRRFSISSCAPTIAAASLRLGHADVDIAARRSARQRQDMEHIVLGVVLGQRAAAADLDVVGMGTDRQHALLLATAARTCLLRQQQRLLDEFGGRRRPEQQAVDPAA